MMRLNPHEVSRWVARLMPILVLGSLGYGTWVFIDLICVDYLLIQRSRKTTAVALLSVYGLLFVLLITSYIRLVWTINFNPGLVPCGTAPMRAQQEKEGTHSGRTLSGDGRERPNSCETGQGSLGGVTAIGPDPPRESEGRGWGLVRTRSTQDVIPLQSGESLRTVPYDSLVPVSPTLGPRRPSPVFLGGNLPPRPISPGHERTWQPLRDTSNNGVLEMPPPLQPQQAPSEYTISRPQSLALWMLPKNLHEFYNMEAFICENDGLPKWCFHCHCWKPDRSHHCGELGRCVRKMDHFCPWVGGVVGETSFKFFYQTVVYGATYCIFVLVTTAVMINDRGTTHSSIPQYWLALLVIAVFFGLFSAGMVMTTTQFILRNTTTIDNLSAANKVYQIAIYDPLAAPVPVSSAWRDSACTSTTVGSGQAPHLAPSNAAVRRITFPDADPALANLGTTPKRTFAIARTEPGENPWCLPSAMENFKEVMGESVWEWWLPITYSPCTRRNLAPDSEKGREVKDGFYKFNPKLLERLRWECDISRCSERPMADRP